MTPLDLNTNIEQTVQPLMTSQVDRIIEIEDMQYIFCQQGTASTDLRDCWDKSQDRQLTHFLFNLEAEENRKTGQISIFSDVWLLVTRVWNHIWKTLEEKK